MKRSSASVRGVLVAMFAASSVVVGCNAEDPSLEGGAFGEVSPKLAIRQASDLAEAAEVKFACESPDNVMQKKECPVRQAAGGEVSCRQGPSGWLGECVCVLDENDADVGSTTNVVTNPVSQCENSDDDCRYVKRVPLGQNPIFSLPFSSKDACEGAPRQNVCSAMCKKLADFRDTKEVTCCSAPTTFHCENGAAATKVQCPAPKEVRPTSATCGFASNPWFPWLASYHVTSCNCAANPYTPPACDAQSAACSYFPTSVKVTPSGSYDTQEACETYGVEHCATACGQGTYPANVDSLGFATCCPTGAGGSPQIAPNSATL